MKTILELKSFEKQIRKIKQTILAVHNEADEVTIKEEEAEALLDELYDLIRITENTELE